MGWILVGAVVVVLLTIALVVDLRDRKRGGRPLLVRGNGPRTARWEALRESHDPALSGMKGFQGSDAHRGG